MIQLGICTGLENAGILAQAGYNYIETALNGVAAMDEEDFARARDALARSGIPCPVVNCMLPGDLPVVGPGADLKRAEAYLVHAFSRARTLGVGTVVFGSGASRGVPDGFSRWKAWGQLREYLTLADRCAGEYGLNIAVEPLRRDECNIINRVSEALELAALLNLPNVGVLGDTYHMSMEDEPLAVLADAGDRLWHVHMACPQGRAFPMAGDPADLNGEYRQLFGILHAAGYQGRVSIEGSCEDMAAGARDSFALLGTLL